MNKKLLEQILKNSYIGVDIKEVVESKIVSAVEEGENYSSLVKRVKLKVILNSGETIEKSLIMKEGHHNKIIQKTDKELNIFATEAKMYKVIFREMEKLMEECEDEDDKLWCDYIHYDVENRALILEDLKTSGFRTVSRQKGFDLDLSLLVMKSIGKFHALTKVLETKGVIKKEEFKPYALINELEFTQIFPYTGTKCFGKTIKESWGAEWSDIGEKMDMPVEVYMEKLKESEKLGENDFTCLNHGDIWSNNIMIKFDSENKPESARFLDYSGPHYHSPCVDVTYFMNVAIQPSVRRSNYNSLLKCYHDSLINNLDKYGFTGRKPSFVEIEEVMERMSFFGFTMLAFLYPIATCQAKDAFDVVKLMETKGEEGFNLEIFKEDGLMEKVGEDLKYYIKKHFSN